MPKLFVLSLISAIALLLSACAAPIPEPIEVQVQLNEFGILSSQTEFLTDQPYRFVIENQGLINHELMIMEPLSGDDMGMSMESMDEMALAMIEADDLTPGTVVELDVTFTRADARNTLEFACHVEGHYESGMKLHINVTEG